MESESGSVVAAENLSRRFGSRRAVDGVTFGVARGESLALFGPNGAGKTTLLRMLGGMLRPSSGSARIDGAALPGGPNVRRRIGVISHHSLLYDALTPRENVEFAARLYGIRQAGEVQGRAEAALGRMQILDRADTPVRALSRGMRQRVSIARAIVHDPSVVLADEPFTGLDAAGAGALAALLGDLMSGGACLVLVTHNLEEGLALATHAAVMNEGRIVRIERTAGLEREAFAQDYQRMVVAGG